jgi:hypothetical protein
MPPYWEPLKTFMILYTRALLKIYDLKFAIKYLLLSISVNVTLVTAILLFTIVELIIFSKFVKEFLTLYRWLVVSQSSCFSHLFTMQPISFVHSYTSCDRHQFGGVLLA